MKPVLYSENETAYTSNGLGRLSDAISCSVTEELNGVYELAMQYPVTGIHAGLITEGAQIFVSHDESGDRQPFRIYKRTDTIDGIFTVLARHITADLSRIPVLPFTANSAATALAGLASHAVVTIPFTFSTELTGSGAWGLEVPTSAKAAIGSGDGSILSVFGGELRYDKRNVYLLTRRGSETSVSIRYAKNMTGLEVAAEASAAYSAVVPFCKTQSGVITCTPPIVQHGTGATEAVPLDLSDAFDYVPSAAQLEAAAIAWLNKNQPWIAEKAVTVSFVQLRDTEEYKGFAPLEQVLLGDSVKVVHTELGVDADFRVLRTEWNALEDRYASLTLGREQRTLATMISEMTQKIQEARDIAQEIANGTYTGGTFINGQLIYAPEIYGGNIHIGQRQGGGYNFFVDQNGNMESHGSIHLLGPDTKIMTPTILSNAFSVFPRDATDQEISDLTIPSGFNLYDRAYSLHTLYNLLNIHQSQEYTVFSSPSGGYARLTFNQITITGRGYYTGSGKSGADAEIAVMGDIPDVSSFVTASTVQEMIDAAITPPEPDPQQGGE